MPLPETPPPLPAPAAPSWLRRHLLAPFLDLLKAGLSPGQLALTVGLGVAFGVVPVFGVTTVLSAATALRLRLNVAAMQLVAHLMSVVQLALLVPFLRAGAGLMGYRAQVDGLTLAGIRHLIAREGWRPVVRLLWRAELGALLIWAAAAVPLVVGLYFGLRAVFRRVQARHAAAGAVARPLAGS